MRILDTKTNLTLMVTYCAYGLLMAVITIDSLNVEGNFLKIWLIQLTPLLLLFPGLFAKYYRSFSWLCFLMLAYFTGYVVQTYSSTRDPYDWVGLSLSIIIFISSMLASRWLQYLHKRLHKQTPIAQAFKADS